MCGLASEVKSWGYVMPAASAVSDALFSSSLPPIEWNRTGVFQDVTMRLLAEVMLPAEHVGQDATYAVVRLSCTAKNQLNSLWLQDYGDLWASTAPLPGRLPRSHRSGGLCLRSPA